jgi:methionyl-tRNA formyltransferase
LWFDYNITPLEKIVDETKPDIGISILYPKIVPGRVLDKVEFLNLHCAPLPKYKGYNSSLWAILNQEKEFGVTLHRMDDEVDHGPIIEMRSFKIPNDITNIELYKIIILINNIEIIKN